MENIGLELTLSPAGSSADEPSPAMAAEEYVKVLEEEEKTIKAMEPELPLYKRLLSDAIEDLRKKKKKKNKEKMESCSGKRSSLRIFGKLVTTGDDEEEEEQAGGGGGGGKPQEMECRTNYQGNKWIIGSPDKMRAQFAEGEKELFPSNGNAIASFGGLFPFAAISEEKKPRFILPNLNISATPGGGWASGSGSKPALLAAGHHLINSQSHHRPPNKARLCWTAELHRRFLSAIEQLGGEQAATPKRIRDLMKVDGVTSDQVRSHLQKYRLSAQKALDSSDTTTSNESGVASNNDCVEQQRVWQFGFPQLPPDSAQEMPIPSDAGDSRQEEDDSKSD